MNPYIAFSLYILSVQALPGNKTHNINLFAPCFSVWAKGGGAKFNVPFSIIIIFSQNNFSLLCDFIFKWALDWLWSLIHYVTELNVCSGQTLKQQKKKNKYILV